MPSFHTHTINAQMSKSQTYDLQNFLIYDKVIIGNSLFATFSPQIFLTHSKHFMVLL